MEVDLRRHPLLDVGLLLAPILSMLYGCFLDSDLGMLIRWDCFFRLWQWFTTVDTDRSGAITAVELGACRFLVLKMVLLNRKMKRGR